MKTETKTQTLQIRLTKKQQQEFKRTAKMFGISVSELIIFRVLGNE
jgi:uncharacterized protein (DUF1778 family)